MMVMQSPNPPSDSVADATQTLLTRFVVALNRRRAYRPSHPIVVRAEQQLLESITAVMAARQELKLGVSPRELLLDGQKVRSRLSVTREGAARPHRRGVSSLERQCSAVARQIAVTPGHATNPA